MIYPTRAAILAVVAGVPVTIVVAVMVPGRWYAALAWPLAILLAIFADALLGARPGAASIRIDLPRTVPVGASVDARVGIAFSGSGAPKAAEIALAPDPILTSDDDGRWPLPVEQGLGVALVPLVAHRRGTALIDRVWLRWHGPLGLVWKQRAFATDARVAILPDVRAVTGRRAQIYERQALAGLIAQTARGDGTDFDALAEYRSGMDRRAIDWKQSARHLKLYAKEYRSERNNQIVFALDAGRQMSAPVAGLPRIDRAISAVLLAAWVALKLGDRVSLHAFDSRPRIVGGFVSGAGAFAALQHLAAAIDYSGEESNYSFALTTLGAKLTRRSMIVLFTEITDPVAAEFMIRSAAQLMRTHLMLVVVLRDEELEAIIDGAPETADDVVRAVTAAALLKERLLVLTRLRHLGAHIIECEHDAVGEQLAAGYLDLKRRNLL